MKKRMAGQACSVEDWMDKGGMVLYGTGVGQVVGTLLSQQRVNRVHRGGEGWCCVHGILCSLVTFLTASRCGSAQTVTYFLPFCSLSLSLCNFLCSFLSRYFSFLPFFVSFSLCFCLSLSVLLSFLLLVSFRV